MIKALFLDRDGVINKDSRYPHKPEHIEFCDGIFSLCKKALEKGYEIFVMTNQAGIAKGFFTEKDLIELHKWMGEEFAKQGIPIRAFYYCPYHKNGTVTEYRMDSDLRKPRPGMFQKAVQEHGIDISKSLMVGDKESDRIELSGLRSVIIKSQYVTDGYDFEQLSDIEKVL